MKSEQPSCSLTTARARAKALTSVRSWMRDAGILEVEVPSLAPFGTVDPWIDSLEVRTRFQQKSLWLQTSPEFFLKRLVAAGWGDVGAIKPVWRDEPAGARHLREFTMVEWYRTRMDLSSLCRETEAVCRAAIPEFPPCQTATYAEVLQSYAGVEPHADPEPRLREAALDRLPGAPDLGLGDRDGWLDILLGAIVEPQLGRDEPLFVTRWPSSKAALARIDPGPPAVALRAELYWKGVELANGYDELTDSREQRRRFLKDARTRRSRGLATPAPDLGLCDELTRLGPCAGMALGFDRLLMAAWGAPDIRAVRPFGDPC